VRIFTEKRYGYAMAQVMESMYGKLAGELVKLMGKELRSVCKHRRPEVICLVMLQLSMKAATVKFGEAWTTKACTAKIKQIHIHNTFVPEHPKGKKADPRVIHLCGTEE
jgi:hypothetical protein